MNKELTDLIVDIAKEHRENIDSDSNRYKLVSITDAAKRFNYEGLESYANTKIIVPLKNIKGGKDFHVDGSGFRDYVQLTNGIVVHKDLAKDIDMPSTKYTAYRAMILNMLE